VEMSADVKARVDELWPLLGLGELPGAPAAPGS
jgi:hypothetical protein